MVKQHIINCPSGECSCHNQQMLTGGMQIFKAKSMSESSINSHSTLTTVSRVKMGRERVVLFFGACESSSYDANGVSGLATSKTEYDFEILPCGVTAPLEECRGVAGLGYMPRLSAINVMDRTCSESGSRSLNSWWFRYTRAPDVAVITVDISVMEALEG